MFIGSVGMLLLLGKLLVWITEVAVTIYSAMVLRLHLNERTNRNGSTALTWDGHRVSSNFLILWHVSIHHWRSRLLSQHLISNVFRFFFFGPLIFCPFSEHLGQSDNNYLLMQEIWGCMNYSRRNVAGDATQHLISHWEDRERRRKKKKKKISCDRLRFFETAKECDISESGRLSQKWSWCSTVELRSPLCSSLPHDAYMSWLFLCAS